MYVYTSVHFYSLDVLLSHVILLFKYIKIKIPPYSFIVRKSKHM
jgi:hypothetical protein